jgi:hypothetical protein
MPQQRRAGLRQAHAAGRAEYEAMADVALEPLELLTDRWLGPAEVAGGGRERASAADGPEDKQAARIEFRNDAALVHGHI